MTPHLLTRPLALALMVHAIPTAPAMPLQSATVIAPITSPQGWLLVEDLNRDGRPDIVAATPEQNLRWWRNVDGQTFSQQPDIPITGGSPVWVMAANVDRDADIDFIVLIDPGNAAGRLQILKNDGSGAFAKTGEIVLTGKLIPGSFPLVEDFDRDGDLDIMLAHQDAAQTPGNDPLSLALNDGIGGFAAPTTVTSALNWPTALAWHDCDRNGLPDLLVATTGVPQLRLYRNYKPGGGVLVADLVPAPPAGIQEIIGLNPGRLVVRYDGPGSGNDSGIQSRISFEGYLDWTSHVVAAAAPTVVDMKAAAFFDDEGTGLIYVRRHPATLERSLHLAVLDRFNSTVSLGPTTARAVQAADIDNDGDTDLILLRDTDIALHRNNSIRPTTALTDASVSLSLTHPAVDVLAVADVLPDPGPEIIGALTAEGSIRVFALEGIQPQPGVIVASAAPGVTALKTGDLDGDGDIDLVFNSPGDGRVKWSRNNGNGTFAAPVSILAQPNPGPLDLGDLDRDGDLDVVMTFDDGSVIIAMNSGTTPPTWSFENGGSTGATPIAIQIADIVPGNRQEFLVQTFAFGAPANASALRLHRWLVFPSPGWYPLPLASGTSGVRGIAVADVDGDSDLDVVAGPGPTPALYLNNGSGILGDPVASNQADFSGTRQLMMLDLDGNGSQEIIGVNAGAVMATTVTGTGIGAPVTTDLPFADLQLRDVAPISIFGTHDYLVVSDTVTPALRMIRNNIRTITHAVTTAGTAPDLRGTKAAVFSVSLTNQAPAGGPTVSLHTLYATLKVGDAPMPMDLFPQLVTGVEVWRDLGTLGVFDPSDSLVTSSPASLSGDGFLAISLAMESLPPSQTGRWLVVFDLAAAAHPNVHQFSATWGGDALRLTAFATGDHGASGVITAVTPPTVRTLTLASMSPLQQWRHSWWGSPDNNGPGGDQVDGDGESTPNLAEYALGTNPTAADGPALVPTLDASNRLTVATAFSHPPRSDITITLEITNSLASASWSLLATRTGAGEWAGPAIVTVGPTAAGRQSFTFTDPTAANPKERFVRFRVHY